MFWHHESSSRCWCWAPTTLLLQPSPLYDVIKKEGPIFLLTLLHHNLQHPPPSTPPSPLLQLDSCISFLSNANDNPPPLLQQSLLQHLLKPLLHCLPSPLLPLTHPIKHPHYHLPPTHLFKLLHYHWYHLHLHHHLHCHWVPVGLIRGWWRPLTMPCGGGYCLPRHRSSARTRPPTPLSNSQPCKTIFNELPLNHFL